MRQRNAEVAAAPRTETAFTQRAERLADRGLFLKKFLAKGRGISAATPSSRALVAGMLREVDFSRPATIIELGAGTGPVTEALLDRIRPHHRFVAVENDPDFCTVLRRRFPELTLLEADATRITAPLQGMGVRQVDVVISGLPTPNLPHRAKLRLLRWLRTCLAPDGVFVQLTIVPLFYRGFYERLFESVEHRIVWLNLPPGGVYVCRRPRRHV